MRRIAMFTIGVSLLGFMAAESRIAVGREQAKGGAAGQGAGGQVGGQAGQGGAGQGGVGQGAGGLPGAQGGVKQGGTGQGVGGQAGQGGVGQGVGGQPGAQGGIKQGGTGQGVGGQAGAQGGVGQGVGGQANATTGLPSQPMIGQPGYFGYTQTPWFGNSTVQNQLNLTPEQMNQMNTAYGNAWNKFSTGMSNLGTLGEQERATKLQELSNTLNSQVMQSAQGTLQPTQFQRFQQLNAQYQGLNSLADPNVQSKLNLTPDQMRQIDALRDQQNQTLMGIYKQYSTDPTAAANQFRQFRQQNSEQLNSILNDQQRQAWQQITGEPFDFTPDALRNQK